MDGVLIVVLRMFLEPPAAPRTDPLVLGEPPQRLLGNLLGDTLDGIIRRRHRLAELRVAAHLGQVGVEFLDLRKHRLGLLEPLLVNVETVAHGTPHRVVAPLHPDVVGEKLLPHGR